MTSEADFRIESIIRAGMKYIGTPYEYGSSRSHTRTFDCSGLMIQIFKEGGDFVLPASSSAQGSYVKSKGSAVTDITELSRGDLAFFMSYRGTSEAAYRFSHKSNRAVTHVALYLGNGTILHAHNHPGVSVSPLFGNHWEYRFLFGGPAL